MFNNKTQFLQKEEELLIKSEFISLKNNDQISPFILNPLLQLNLLYGFVIVDFSIENIQKPYASVVLKFIDEYTFPITEMLYDLDRDKSVNIEWDSTVYVTIMNKLETIDHCTIITTTNGIDLLETLVFYLVD